MARLPRYFVKDQPQHVIVRGNNRNVIFAAESDYRFYLECLQDAAVRHELKIHSYVLMTNHVHLLASPAGEQSLPKTLQSVGRRYVQYFNYCYQRTGTLWEGRYRATIIDTEGYLLTCMRYIELNPLRAQMADHPREYVWSSYACNALGKENSLITPHLLYRRLGRSDPERQSAYRALFRSHIEVSELATIRDATNKGWALGSTRFREKIEQLSQRRTQPKPRGRPRDED
jgi:putative transposase